MSPVCTIVHRPGVPSATPNAASQWSRGVRDEAERLELRLRQRLREVHELSEIWQRGAGRLVERAKRGNEKAAA